MHDNAKTAKGVLSTLAVVALCLASCTLSIEAPPTMSRPRGADKETHETMAASEYAWQQFKRRDAIPPIYEPEFVPADDAGYSDDELVVGVAIGDEAKAYPVGPLHAREIVNDELGDIPILVTY